MRNHFNFHPSLDTILCHLKPTSCKDSKLHVAIWEKMDKELHSEREHCRQICQMIFCDIACNMKRRMHVRKSFLFLLHLSHSKKFFIFVLQTNFSHANFIINVRICIGFISTSLGSTSAFGLPFNSFLSWFAPRAVSLISEMFPIANPSVANISTKSRVTGFENSGCSPVAKMCSKRKTNSLVKRPAPIFQKFVT